MNILTYKPQLIETFQKVRELSYKEKKEGVFDEKKIDLFLDTILEFKKVFTNKSSNIESLIDKLEEITWFNQLDKDSLLLINDLISSIRDLHSSLLRQYVSLNLILSKGIAKDEIMNFKNAIDDLRDVANDLDSRFFFLPHNMDFQETTKELSLV